SLTADPDCYRDNFENRLSKIVALAFAPWGDLLVADSSANSIWRLSAGGAVQNKLKIVLPTTQPIRNIAVSNNCSIWVVTGYNDQSLELWMARREDAEFKSASI